MLHHPFQNNVIIHSYFTQMRKNSVFALLYYGAVLPSCKAIFHERSKTPSSAGRISKSATAQLEIFRGELTDDFQHGRNVLGCHGDF